MSLESLPEYFRLLGVARRYVKQREEMRELLAGQRGSSKESQYIPGVGRPQDIYDRCDRELQVLRGEAKMLNEHLAGELIERHVTLNIEHLRALENEPVSISKVENAMKFLREVDSAMKPAPALAVGDAVQLAMDH